MIFRITYPNSVSNDDASWSCWSRKNIVDIIYSHWCANQGLIHQMHRAVFKWLSKNQNQSSYSDQSQQEQTARWTNHNSQQLPVTRSKRGKNHEYMVWLVLVLNLHWLKNWRESFKPITKRSNRNQIITFDSHLKTALNGCLINILLSKC